MTEDPRLEKYGHVLPHDLRPNRAPRPPSKAVARVVSDLLTDLEAGAVAMGREVDWETLTLGASKSPLGGLGVRVSALPR